MLILSKKISELEHIQLTPAQQAVDEFCNQHCPNHVSLIEDIDNNKTYFKPHITQLSNNGWSIVRLNGCGINGDKMKIIYCSLESIGWWEYIVIPVSTRSSDTLKEAKIPQFNVGEQIPYRTLQTLLFHSNLPKYIAGYDDEHEETYCDIPGLPEDAYAHNLIPPEWIPVEWVGHEIDVGYNFVLCPKELWKYVEIHRK